MSEDKIQIRRGTSAQGAVTVLDDGELGYDRDAKVIRVGDGVTPGGTVLGAKGETGNTGATGATGDPGTAATIAIGIVTTGAPGSSVSIANTGTTSNAVLDITIPQGATGASGSGTGDMLKSTYDTNGNGKVDQLDDNSATDNAIGNRTATDATPPTSLIGTLTTHLINIYSMFKAITGGITGIAAPIASLKSLFEQPNFIGSGLCGNDNEHGFKIMFRRDMTITAIYYTFDTAPTASIVVNNNINGALMASGAKSLSGDYAWTGLTINVSKGDLYQPINAGVANGFKLCSIMIEAVNR